MALDRPQDGSRQAQDRPEIAARDPKAGPRRSRSKTGPRQPKTGLRWPKTSLSQPKMSQETAKRRPRQPKTSPRQAQKTKIHGGGGVTPHGVFNFDPISIRFWLQFGSQHRLQNWIRNHKKSDQNYNQVAKDPKQQALIGFVFGLFGGNLLSTMGPLPAKMQKSNVIIKILKSLQNHMKCMYPIRIGLLYTCWGNCAKYPGPPPSENAKNK